MTNSSPWDSWPIEIVVLPVYLLNMVDLSMAMLNSQMVMGIEWKCLRNNMKKI